jgi:hypothetical protein
LVEIRRYGSGGRGWRARCRLVADARAMRRAATLSLLVAITFFVAAVVLALVPVRATPVEYATDPGAKLVDCGSFPFRTEWSGDAGCDKARTKRIRLWAPFVLASIPIGLVGEVLLLASRSRQDS